jgi:hypothetical protein
MKTPIDPVILKAVDTAVAGLDPHGFVPVGAADDGRELWVDFRGPSYAIRFVRKQDRWHVISDRFDTGRSRSRDVLIEAVRDAVRLVTRPEA